MKRMNPDHRDPNKDREAFFVAGVSMAACSSSGVVGCSEGLAKWKRTCKLLDSWDYLKTTTRIGCNCSKPFT